MLLRLGKGAEYCDQPVCLCVCLRAYLWNRWTDRHEICMQIPVVVARSSSGGVALRYVFTVLRMTSRLVVMGATPKGGGCGDCHEGHGDTGAESDVYECLLRCDCM